MAPALLAALGQNDAALYASSDDALDMLERGDATLAYNVLESYTATASNAAPRWPSSTRATTSLMLSRAALIPRQAPRPDLGAMFRSRCRRAASTIAQAFGMRPVGDSVVPAARRPLGWACAAELQDALKKRHFLTCGGGGRRRGRQAPACCPRKRRAANGTPGRRRPAAVRSGGQLVELHLPFCITSGMCSPRPSRQDTSRSGLPSTTSMSAQAPGAMTPSLPSIPSTPRVYLRGAGADGRRATPARRRNSSLQAVRRAQQVGAEAHRRTPASR